MTAKILIVDDEPDILETLYNVLSEEAYQVTKALGGKKAIELFRSAPFDLVITDLKMPEPDGLEVMRQIRERDDTAEIIVLTGFASLETAVRALRDYKAYDYLAKPLDEIDEILIVIERALERRRLLRENRTLVERLQKINEELEKRVEARTAELTRANRELKQAREDAEMASQAKSDFLSCIGHEFRTPLNNIVGFGDLLLSNHGQLNATQKEYLSYIVKSGEDIANLIDSILEFSNVSSGKIERNDSVIDLKTLLDKSMHRIKEKAAEKGIGLSTYTTDMPMTIRADEYKLIQIVYNLLSNAVKFTPAGGEIKLTARMIHDARTEKCPACSALEIRVEDTGIGLEEKDLERIFNPFEQTERYLRRSQGGTGLGLALTKKLVELHGGRIWAESRGRGKGAVFSVVIPV